MDTTHSSAREKQIKRVLWVTFGLNVFVALLKIIVGHINNSLSLTSSGLESMFDGSANIIALLAMSFAAKPPDREHHFGHNKFENLGSLVIAILLLFSAYQMGESIFEIDEATRPTRAVSSYVAIIVSLLVSIGVSLYEKREGEKLKSPILLADSSHTFGDFILSFGVILSLIMVDLGFWWADYVVSGIICLYLIMLAIKIVKTNMPDLLDASPDISMNLIKQVESIPKIENIHNFRARGTQHWMNVDFHLLLQSDLSLKEAHEIGHQAESMIKDLLKEYAKEVDVIVHIEPYERNHTD